MSVEVIYDVSSQAQAVTVMIEVNSGNLIVPPVALGPGTWIITWTLPTGYTFNSVTFSTTSTRIEGTSGWPPQLVVGPSALSDNPQQWTATLTNNCVGANAGVYTISVQPPGGGTPITKDPTIVVTKDPIDMVNS